ncbi:MAG TPA: type II toxin-antitoxin system CcdA family antitoxin [Acidimicrobiales bacterium]|nr:type II toxin-antitoxin system CcdA family antitoxin [Acidimicrobiales bacterium]
MNTPKRKVSVSVDADLADELENDADGTLSAAVNTALRAQVQQRGRPEALRALLDELDTENGPLGPEHDPEIERIVAILSGGPA